MRLACQRCGEEVSLLFPSLGRRVCFACLGSVLRLTSGYAALQDMAATDMGDAMAELGRRETGEADAAHCIRCFSPGAAVPGPAGRLCLACSLVLAG